MNSQKSQYFNIRQRIYQSGRNIGCKSGHAVYAESINGRNFGKRHSKCPRCLTYNETVDSVIHCPHQDSSLFWYTGLECLKDYIIKQNSSPGLALAISDILLHWNSGEGIHTVQRLIWKIQAMIYSHYLLGWDNVCFGLVRKNITDIQQSFLEDSGYKSSGEVWMS